MRRHVFLGIAVLAFLSKATCFGDDNDDALSIQFVREDGKPIPEALFYLYERKNGEFQRALYRHHKMDDSARITLETIPKEFTIGVVSSKHFYHTFWDSPDIAIKSGTNVIKVKPPTDHLEQDAARKVYESEGISIASLEDRVAHVVQSAFGGRRIVIFSGGAAKGSEALLEEIRGIAKGGGFGSIIGRNSFQRPKTEALELLATVMDVYKQNL